MRKIYLGFFVFMVCTGMCLGQTRDGHKTVSSRGSSDSGVVLTSGTRVSAQLQERIDAKNAKVGDEVLLRTTQEIKQNGQVIVPKGSTLIGRITDVSRRTRNDAGSRIGIIFDRIQGKRLSMPINASIVAITQAAVTASSDDTLLSDVSATSQTSASASGKSSGGGLIGGVGSTVGGLVGTTTQTLGTVTDTVNQTAGTTARSLAGTLKGVQISASSSGSANSSTTLSSPDRNIRVEKGATFHLRVNE